MTYWVYDDVPELETRTILFVQTLGIMSVSVSCFWGHVFILLDLTDQRYFFQVGSVRTCSTPLRFVLLTHVALCGTSVPSRSGRTSTKRTPSPPVLLSHPALTLICMSARPHSLTNIFVYRFMLNLRGVYLSTNAADSSGSSSGDTSTGSDMRLSASVVGNLGAQLTFGSLLSETLREQTQADDGKL